MQYLLAPALLLLHQLVSFTNGQVVDGPLLVELAWTQSAILDIGQRYIAFWSVHGSANDANSTIEFELHVKTLGWIGLGFSPSGTMAGADIVIAGYRTSGKTPGPYIYDRHGPPKSNGYPPEDVHQDYELLSARKNATHTAVRFRRKLDTCDVQDQPITANTQHVIWAFGTEDALSVTEIKKHAFKNRGVRSLLLIGTRPTRTSPPSDSYPMDLTLVNVTVPSTTDTVYWCRIFKFALGDREHQLIGFEPIFQRGNEGHLHHVLLYSCSGAFPDDMVRPAGFDCLADRGATFDLGSCNDVVAGWAIGGGPFFFDDNLGYPLLIPATRSSASSYFILEVHFDNSNFDNFNDNSSGLRLHLTEQLRPIELEMLILGNPVAPRDFLMIPPGFERLTSYAICDAQCTSTLPDTGITIMGGLLHAHLLGIAIRVRLIRNGVELAQVAADEHYDFNYQTTREFDVRSTIYPNDTLIVECDYDSRSRSKMTYAGYSTHDEMCLAFLYYYPRSRTSSFFTCASNVADVAFANLFGTQISRRDFNSLMAFVEVGSPPHEVSLADFANECGDSCNWQSEQRRDAFQALLASGPHTEECFWRQTAPDGQESDLLRVFGIQRFPEPTTAYTPPPSVCSNSSNAIGG